MKADENKLKGQKKEGFSHLIELFQNTQTNMQGQAVRAVDTALVIRNWLFGYYIVEFENAGADRSEIYGKELLKKLSNSLSKSLGKGFSKRSLEQYKKFYLSYKKIAQTLSAQSLESQEKIAQALPAQSFLPQKEQEKIWQTLSAQSLNNNNSFSELTLELSKNFNLTWSHYIVLLSVKNSDERKFYEIEAYKNCWGVRELKRQFHSALYERLSLSRDKDEIKQLSEKGLIVETPKDIIKDPIVLEFLGLEEKSNYSENDMETAIINNLESFLLELGSGFLFEARQKRFSFDTRHFFVDLVFYNRLLRSYVLIDLKIGDLKHQDLGQMQMYVNYFDRYVKLEDENPTIGILLCHDKSDDLVELTLPKDSNIYASNYELYLPKKEALKQVVAEATAEWESQQKNKGE